MTDLIGERDLTELERDLTALFTATPPDKEFSERLAKQLRVRAEALSTSRIKTAFRARWFGEVRRPAFAFALSLIFILIIVLSILGPQRVLAGVEQLVSTVSEIRFSDLVPSGLIKPVPSSTPTPTEIPTSSPVLTHPAPLALSPGQTVTISFINMIDAANGWAIGGKQDPGDRVLRTRDGGLTWQDVTPPFQSADENAPGKLKNAFFLNATSAWIAVYYLPEVEVPEGFRSTGKIWRTQDGGLTWEASEPIDLYITLFSSPEGPIIDPSPPPLMQFLDNQRGWILIRNIGSGMHRYDVALYKTQDSGLHWEKVINSSDSARDGGLIQSAWKNGMTFADEQTGWSTTDGYPLEAAFIRFTSDGGASWRQSFLPPPGFDPGLVKRAYCADQHSPHLFSPTFGMLVVDCITHDKQVQPADILYITEDGGRNWRTRPYPGGSLQMLDPRLGWALSRDIYQTTNGGRTWEKLKTVNWDGQFDFINEKIGFAVARSDGRVAFVHTFDGGRSWVLLQPTIGKPSVHPPGSPTSVPLSTQTPTPTLQSIPAPRPMAEQPVTITYIDMIDATQGWAIGRFADTHDNVLSTRDGGLTWRDVTPPQLTVPGEWTGKIPTGVFPDGQAAVIVAYHFPQIPSPDDLGVVLWRTLDGGVTWQPSRPIRILSFETVGYPPPLIQFPNQKTLWLLIRHAETYARDTRPASLYRLRDVGVLWEPEFISKEDFLPDCEKTGLAFFGSQNGKITLGQCPVGTLPVVSTSNGGRIWKEVSLPAPEFEPDSFPLAACTSVHSPHLFSRRSAALVMECQLPGKPDQPLSFLYFTDDGWKTWRSSPFPGGALIMLNPRAGWALSRKIYQTLDGGLTWEHLKTVDWDGQFDFVSQSTGFAVARSEGRIGLVRTEDGGRTWQLLEPMLAP